MICDMLSCIQMEELKTNYFIALCGIPGSGKSTLSKKLAQTYNAKLYSYDDICRQSELNDVHEMRAHILTSIAEDLRNGYNVIFDDVNILTSSRIEVLLSTEDIKCSKVLVVMNTPLEECLHRNANRKKRLPDWAINHMHRKYQVPTFNEGWDEILYC